MVLSDSFIQSIAGLVTDVRAGMVELGAGEPPGARGGDVSAVLVLAGGAEAVAADLLAELPAAAVPRYVVGATTDHRVISLLLRRGARDYFALPGDIDLLRRTLERECRRKANRADADRFAEEERIETGFDSILGRSAALRATLDQAARVAELPDVTVLLRGETGPGKELLARAIHYHSPRAGAPFVEINCTAIPAALLESELFGHEKGAFTGAVGAKPGLFELADGGTIFLDEVGHLPLELQPKLLRALESRAIRRVGGNVVRHVDVRLIGATHVDLEGAVASGEFREDLYYRLNVVALTLPPLRQRDEDVELLADTFLARLARTHGLPVPALTPAVRTLLRLHRWPGNVRELRNAIERALVLSPRGTLREEELRLPTSPQTMETGTIPFPATLQTIMRASALAMLSTVHGNKSEAARKLGISRARLQRLLNGLDDEDDE
jgi:two-component system response regulator HydG